MLYIDADSLSKKTKKQGRSDPEIAYRKEMAERERLAKVEDKYRKKMAERDRLAEAKNVKKMAELERREQKAKNLAARRERKRTSRKPDTPDKPVEPEKPRSIKVGPPPSAKLSEFMTPPRTLRVNPDAPIPRASARKRGPPRRFPLLDET